MHRRFPADLIGTSSESCGFIALGLNARTPSARRSTSAAPAESRHDSSREYGSGGSQEWKVLTASGRFGWWADQYTC